MPKEPRTATETVPRFRAPGRRPCPGRQRRDCSRPRSETGIDIAARLTLDYLANGLIGMYAIRTHGGIPEDVADPLVANLLSAVGRELRPNGVNPLASHCAFILFHHMLAKAWDRVVSGIG